MRLPNPVALLGVCLVLLAAGLAWRTGAFLARATMAQGVVVDGAAHPQIRFKAASGAEIVFVQNGFAGGGKGDVVRVAYDAADPAGTATVAGFWPLWGGTMWAVIPGLSLVLAGLAGASVRLSGAR